MGWFEDSIKIAIALQIHDNRQKRKEQEASRRNPRVYVPEPTDEEVLRETITEIVDDYYSTCDIFEIEREDIGVSDSRVEKIHSIYERWKGTEHGKHVNYEQFYLLYRDYCELEERVSEPRKIAEAKRKKREEIAVFRKPILNILEQLGEEEVIDLWWADVFGKDHRTRAIYYFDNWSELKLTKTLHQVLKENDPLWLEYQKWNELRKEYIEKETIKEQEEAIKKAKEKKERKKNEEKKRIQDWTGMDILLFLFFVFLILGIIFQVTSWPNN